MTKRNDKDDEIMRAIKKAIKKHGDAAASGVDEVTEVVAEGTSHIVSNFDDIGGYVVENGKLSDNFITKADAKKSVGILNYEILTR